MLYGEAARLVVVAVTAAGAVVAYMKSRQVQSLQHELFATGVEVGRQLGPRDEPDEK